jgi:acetyl-CoA carboxylase beta subunit
MSKFKRFHDAFVDLEQINLWQKEHATSEEKLNLLIQQNELKEHKAINEVNRIDVGWSQLRIMKENENHWCEILESGKWSRISAAKLHQLSFDKRVYNWLNQHLNSTDNIQNPPNNKSDSLEQNTSVRNKKSQVSILTTFLRNFLLNK